MNRKEYMKSLLDQGIEDQKIISMVDEKFPNGDDTDMPGKQKDPAAAETSTGSEDLVSKSEDSFLDYRIKKEEINPNRLDAIKITSLESRFEKQAGISVWASGNVTERTSLYRRLSEADKDKFYFPEYKYLSKIYEKQKRNDNIASDAYEGLTSLFGQGDENFEDDQNIRDEYQDRTGILGESIIGSLISSVKEDTPVAFRNEYLNEAPIDSKILTLSFDGSKLDSKLNEQYGESKFRNLDVSKMRQYRTNRVSEEEYKKEVQLRGGEKENSFYIYQQGEKFLTGEERSYLKLKNKYYFDNSISDEQKKSIEKELNSFDFGKDVYDPWTGKTKKLNNTSKENQESIEKAKEIAETSTAEELDISVAKSYAKVVALSKDFSEYIDYLNELPNSQSRRIADAMGGDTSGRSALKFQLSTSQKIATGIKELFGSESTLDKTIDAIEKIAETGEIPEVLPMMPGSHPVSTALNEALKEYVSLNRAAQLNINPTTEKEKEGFISGVANAFFNTTDELGVTKYNLDQHDRAKYFTNAIRRNPNLTDKIDINKESLEESFSNRAGSGTFELGKLVFELLGTRRMLPLNGFSKLQKIVDTNKYIQNSRKLKFATNAVLSGGKEAFDFVKLEVIKGSTFEEVKQTAPFGFSLGVGNYAASRISNKILSTSIINNPIMRGLSKYNSATYLGNQALAASTGSAVYQFANLVNGGAKDMTSEEILESFGEESLKMLALNFMTKGVRMPLEFRDLSRAMSEDFAALKGRDKNSERAAENLKIDHSIIDNVADDAPEVFSNIDNAESSKLKEIQSKLESRSITENEAVEQAKEVKDNALALRNRVEINLHKQRLEQEKKNGKLATESEMFKVASKLANGEELNARENEVLADTPIPMLMNTLGVKGKQLLKDEKTVDFLNYKRIEADEIEQVHNGSREFTTRRSSKEREKVHTYIKELINAQREVNQLKGIENKNVYQKQELAQAESRLEDLESGSDYKEIQDIIDKAAEDNYKKDIEESKKVLKATDEGDIKEVETEEEFQKIYEEVEGKPLQDDFFNYGVYDRVNKTFYINKKVALQQRRVTTGNHETLHFVLRNALKDKNGFVTAKGKQIIDDVLNELTPEQRELVQDKVNKNYSKENGAEVDSAKYYEEYLTAISEAIANKEIVFTKGIGQSLSPLINVFRRRGFDNIEKTTETGKDLFEFIKSYASGDKVGIAKAQAISKASEEAGDKVTVGSAQAKERRSELFKSIDDLVKEQDRNIKSKEEFMMSESFNDIFSSIALEGGAINNYIRSKSSSAEEAIGIVESMQDRLLNFDPSKTRATGEAVGMEGLTENIIANVNFSKRDVAKKLYEEGKLAKQQISIDKEEAREIADESELTLDVAEETQTRRSPGIDPLKFEGVEDLSSIEIKDIKGKTLKQIGKEYAGQVGQKIFDIPAKKITESSANLGSNVEAVNIQRFFNKSNNLEKLIKILPEYNIVTPTVKIGELKPDVSKDVSGTGLGLPKRIINRIYEPHIDPTGALTSPKGRSKGKTSQVPVFRLKPEFRGTPSIETINTLKQEIGITPKGELPVLPKGALRSEIGQMLKGLANTYSTLAANKLIRNKLEKQGAPLQKVADIAGGKRDAMLSREKIETQLGGTKSIKDVIKTLKAAGVDIGDINTSKEIDIQQEEIEDVIKKAGITEAMFIAAKFTNFGVKTVYGEFKKDGNFREFSKKEKETKGSNKLKFKYYALRNNEFVKVPIKKNELGNLIEDKQKADEIKKSRSGDFIPDRSDVYYGTDDPAFKRALALATANSTKELEKVKRVSVKKAGTKEANEQFKVNIEVLDDMVNKLAKAVSEGTVSKAAAIKFITKAYQATSGIIKISAPFKYYSKNPKYGGPLGKREQNSGELFREEHTVPASSVGGYLIYGILTNNSKPVMAAVKKQFFQIKLGKDIDVMLDKSGLADRGAEGFSIFDENFAAARMLEANIKTEGIELMPRLNMNDIISYETNKSYAEELGVTLSKEFWTRENLDMQNRLLMDKIKPGEKEYSNHQEYLNSFVKLEKSKAAVLNQNKFKGVISQASKERKPDGKRILNDLSNRDKALRNARNAKAKVKGISVFDFDDTLATSKSMVGVTMPDGTETKIDATEFAKRGEELLRQGAEFDFSDFSKVVNGKPGPLITKLDKAIKKFGNKDVFVLTARPANSASAIYEFLKGLGYEIPLENITGLANSAPEAKAQWMVDKAAEGYNDFYFTDDAYKNVKAVQDAMKVLDVKSKERIVYKDIYDKMDKEFNDILEAKSGVASEKVYFKAKAEVVGSSQGKFKWFIPPSADDFVGLLYSTLAKGKLGDNQMAWYKKNLLDPYARAMNNISSERVSLAADYKALKKQLGIVPKNLRKKIEGEGFTKEQALRMYIWNKQGMDIPGLSKSDLADMVKYVESDANLQVFADQLIEINKGDGYPAPKDYWLAGSITTDLMDGLGGTKRAKHLEEWQQNVDAIFSEKNLNKLQAIHGKPYREALENMLQRMKSGKNRNYAGDSTTGRMMDWLNGSIGAIMFLNTRSAVLQTLSAVNFINFKDNNILAAGKAFANQPQYWKDFKELFNSDFLKERRDNATITINESDIADMANKGGAKGAISYLLQKGFTPTQIADSFAIASGGATFYRNRIKTYMKEGMSETEAKEKAFIDFRETAEESQQSSRPDRISKQQAGPLGRVVLAFANTPSQYARIIKKASQDLMAGRGDAKTNISKIIYYGAIQGFIFNAIQQALFAADLDDEDEKTEKMVRLGNGMADGVLRGMGVSGAAVAVVKNAGLRVYNESQKDRPKYEKVAFELTKLSPPIASKLSRINQAAREVQWNLDEMKQKGFSLDNPAWLASGNVISATTNIPLDRVIKKVNNVNDALSQDLEMQERIALLAGWQSWELGLEDDKKKSKAKSKPSTPTKIRRSRSRTRVRRNRLSR